jgi:ribose-phosphate pyrophosphokinase
MRKKSHGIMLMRTTYTAPDKNTTYDNVFAHRLFDHFKKKAVEYGIDKEVEPELGETNVAFFDDGEPLPDVKNSVRGMYVYLIHQFLGPDGNYNPTAGGMALPLEIDALGRASAEKVYLVLPYKPFDRQDRIPPETRTSISAKAYAKILMGACTEGLRLSMINMDMHALQEQGFYEIPVNPLEAIPIFIKHYKEKNILPVVVSPDAGGVTRARFVAKQLGTTIAVIDKRRGEDGAPEVMNVVGDVANKDAALIDDVAGTGRTLGNAAKALKNNGANDVYVGVTHGLFSEYTDKKTGLRMPAENNIIIPEIKEIAITDSIPKRPEYFQRYPQIIELSASELFAEAICREIEHESFKPLRNRY